MSAIATHELYYILLFIFGVFVLMRLLAESRFARYLNIVLPAVIGLCLLLMVFNPRIPLGQGLYFGEKASLVASAARFARYSRASSSSGRRPTIRTSASPAASRTAASSFGFTAGPTNCGKASRARSAPSTSIACARSAGSGASSTPNNGSTAGCPT